MIDSVITFIQIFIIGFSFGIAGPCFFVCAPMIVSYIAGKQANYKHTFLDITTFLSGRLLAYIALGYLAGISGAFLKQLEAPELIRILKFIGGIIIVALSFSIWPRKKLEKEKCNKPFKKFFNSGGLFFLGFMIGIFPCPPLITLLLEITLISKTGLSGALYALSFGMGTFLSGIIMINVFLGIFSWLPMRLLKREKSVMIFRIIYIILFVMLGFRLILMGSL